MNMKTAYRYTVRFLMAIMGFSLIVAFPCCTSDKEKDGREDASVMEKPEKEAELDDVHNSDCMNTRSGSLPWETIVMKRDGDIVCCELQNYVANCGLRGFDINMEIAKANGAPDTVLIDVKPEIEAGGKDCMCRYTAYFTLRDLTLDKFYMKCWWYEGMVTLRDTDSLSFVNTLETAVIDGIEYELRHTTHQAIVQHVKTVEGELRIPAELSYRGETYTVISMHIDAFDDCESLTKITIPATMRQLDVADSDADNWNPFRACKSLKAIEVEEGNRWFSSSDGVLFNSNQTKLYSYPASSACTSYIVPESVTTICAYAFSYTRNLTTLSFPNTVTEFGYEPFKHSLSLEHIILPAHLTTIDDYFFRGCTGLKDFVVPAGIERIGFLSFEGCTSLETIDIPESVTSLDIAVFLGCAPKTIIIRGRLNDDCFSRNIFGGMAQTATLYVPATDMERFAKIYHGPISPLD